MSSYRILYHHRIRADDGQAVHVRELIGALRAAGHDVLECALVPKAVPPQPAAPGGAGTTENGADEVGRAWLRLRLPRRITELMEIAYDRHGARMLRRAARSFRPDFIYERHALHCRAGLLASRQLGVPLLLEVNAPMCDEMARLGLLRFARRARRAEYDVLSGAQAVLAVTDVLRQRLIECGARPERTHVIGNGAQPGRYGPETREAGGRLRADMLGADAREAFVLGFVGYLRPWHRLDLAISAMTRPELRQVHLLIAGDGPALPGIRAKADELGVAARLHTPGVIPPHDLPPWLSSCDAALISAINSYASPLKLFDSLAAGVATVAPDQPNLRECIEHGVNGVLFAPEDPDALAEALIAVARDPERTRALGEAGRRSLLERDWTWGGNARRVVEIYQGLRSGGLPR